MYWSALSWRSHRRDLGYCWNLRSILRSMQAISSVSCPRVHSSSPTAPCTLECVGKATEESSDQLYYNLELTTSKPEVKYTIA